MKKTTFLFIVLTAFCANAQDPDLFVYNWQLDHLEIEGVEYFPPTAGEASVIPLTLGADNSIETQVCNTGVGTVTYNNQDNTFSLLSLATTLAICNNSENNILEHQYYQTFFYSNASTPFAYTIVDYPGYKLLTLIAADNNKAFYNSVLLSTPSFATHKVIVTPNPAKDAIHLIFPDMASGRFDLSIFDLTGKLCLSKNNIEKGQAVGVEGLERGMYLVRIETDGNSYTQKLIKN